MKDPVPFSTGVTLIAGENVRPWSVDRLSRIELLGALPVYCDHATYTLPEKGPEVWSAAMLILSWNSPLPENWAEGDPLLISTVRSYEPPSARYLAE